MSSSSMASPAQSHSQPQGAGAATQSDLFPLDFLSFSNFDPTSPQTLGQGQGQASTSGPGSIHGDKGDRENPTPSSTTGMDFDFSQFQSLPPSSGDAGSSHSHNHSRRGSFAGGGRKRGSVSSIGTGTGGGTRPTTAAGMDVDAQQVGIGMDGGLGSNTNANTDFQMMLDATTAAAAAATSNTGHNGEAFDQAGLLQQQLEHMQMQSPLVFGQFNGAVPAAFQQAHSQSQGQGHGQGQGQGQSPYNALAQYLTSPLAQHQTIGDHPGTGQSVGGGNGYSNSNSSSSQDGGDAEKRKWMLATGLGGLFTPGPSGEMIPQIRPEHMSPMQLEMLAREGFDGDFSNAVPLLSPALSHQHNNSAYTSPMTLAQFPSTAPQQPFNHQNQPTSPLEALQIQQRHFQEQLALLQHQQRQLQATAEAVAAASNSPYVAATGAGSSGSTASRPATTPGVSGGPHSSQASPSYFSPLTSPALEASHQRFPRHQHQHQHQQQQHFSPGFDPRGNRRTPHPLSALSSPALNPVGSSGGAQQTLSPALAPQNNADMSDPDYYRALVGMLDGNGANQPGRSAQHRSDGSGSAYASPLPLQAIDTTSLSSPLVGPHSASSSSGPGPNRNSLPVRTRPSPMIKPTPAQRGHHSRAGSTTHSPVVATSQQLQQQQRYPGPTVPQPNYLPPAVIDQRGVQAHHQQMALSTTSETPSPVDLSTIMPPPPVPNNNGGRAVQPMTPAALMNLGGGRSAESGNAAKPDDSAETIQQSGRQGQAQQQQQNTSQSKRQTSLRASQTTRPARKASTSGTTTPTMSASTPGAAGSSHNGNTTNTGKKVKIAPAGKRALAARPPGVGVRAATKGAAAAAALSLPEGETRKTSHKAAEQKRRDSLKAGFDELRLLLPPINTEALDPESGEPIPGSSAPRLLPKSSLVPDDNPNRGVSKVALLKFSNEYIERLHEKVDKRDDYIERLRSEVERLRLRAGADGGDGDTEAEQIKGPDGEDLMEMNMLDGEEEYDGSEEGDEGQEGDGDEEGAIEEDAELGLEDDDLDLDGEDDGGATMELDEVQPVAAPTTTTATSTKDRRRSKSSGMPLKSPALKPAPSSALAKRPSITRGLSNGGNRGRKVEA